MLNILCPFFNNLFINLSFFTIPYFVKSIVLILVFCVFGDKLCKRKDTLKGEPYTSFRAHDTSAPLNKVQIHPDDTSDTARLIQPNLEEKNLPSTPQTPTHQV